MKITGTKTVKSEVEIDVDIEELLNKIEKEIKSKLNKSGYYLILNGDNEYWWSKKEYYHINDFNYVKETLATQQEIEIIMSLRNLKKFLIEKN